MKAKKGSHLARVLEVLAAAGPEGLMVREISEKIDVPAPLLAALLRGYRDHGRVICTGRRPYMRWSLGARLPSPRSFAGGAETAEGKHDQVSPVSLVLKLMEQLGVTIEQLLEVPAPEAKPAQPEPSKPAPQPKRDAPRQLVTPRQASAGKPAPARSPLPPPKPAFLAPKVPKLGLEASEEAVVPAGVKYTVCPPQPDTRFAADPGHVGLFSLEWQQRRAGGSR